MKTKNLKENILTKKNKNMKTEIKRILETYTKDEAKIIYTQNIKWIHELKSEIKEMIDKTRNNVFLDEHEKNFFDRLKQKNLKLQFFETQNSLFLKAKLV